MYEPPKSRLDGSPAPRTTLRHGYLWGWIAIVAGIVGCKALVTAADLLVIHVMPQRPLSYPSMGTFLWLLLTTPVLVTGLVQLRQGRYATALGIVLAVATMAALVAALTMASIPPFNEP